MLIEFFLFSKMSNFIKKGDRPNQLSNPLKDNFSQLSNYLVWDKTLSFKARFVYAWMNSKPSDWTFYMDSMTKEIGMSEDVLRKCLKELIDSGWLRRDGQIMDGNKFSGVCYTLLSEKQKM